MIAVTGDQIEQIAMLAGCGIRPMPGCAGTVIWTLQPDIEALSRRVLNIADDPVAARAVSFGKIVAAHGLGIAREAARQIGGADHGASRGQAAARALARRRGWRSKIAPSIGPRSSAVGTKSRRRQAMISEARPSAFHCGTAPSEKPVSSTRCAPVTSERRTCVMVAVDAAGEGAAGPGGSELLHVGAALRYAGGSAPVRRPTPVTFVDGRNRDISIWWTHGDRDAAIIAAPDPAGGWPADSGRLSMRSIGGISSIDLPDSAKIAITRVLS